MMKNLDHAYDEFVKTHASEIIPNISDFTKKLSKANFRYGRFSIPTFFKAYFLNPEQIHLCKRVSTAITQVINSATRLYFEEGHISHVFKIPDDAAELIKIDPGYSKNVILSRFDGLFEGSSLKLVELNCDSPAGAAYADQAETALLKQEELKDFVEENELMATNRVQGILDALLATYEEFGGYETPNIAIVDWRNVRTRPEFDYIRDYFENRGYKTTIADPRDLKYKGGKLYHKDFRIHVVYRRALFDEILLRLDEVEDMIKAYRDRAVCMVNPLRSRLASTKALLSILSNPEYDHYFTETENRIKQEHIPWTRRLADAEDFYGHKKIYLIDFLKDEKDSLILKPSTGYGGRGVVIGKETPDRDWNSAIDKAVKGDWVVQEFVNVPIITVPTIVNGKLDFAYKKFNFNLLVFGGKFSGGVVRLSDDSVINVAKHGGLIPAITSELPPDHF